MRISISLRCIRVFLCRLKSEKEFLLMTSTFFHPFYVPFSVKICNEWNQEIWWIWHTMENFNSFIISQNKIDWQEEMISELLQNILSGKLKVNWCNDKYFRNDKITVKLQIHINTFSGKVYIQYINRKQFVT